MPNRRQFIRQTAAFGLTTGLLPLLAAGPVSAAEVVIHVAPTRRPNILFIMSDDHATQAIGAYGSRLAPLNPTPVIDRLAREGILFKHAYCNNSICTPSRASILTGQYSQANGVLTLNDKLPPANPTFTVLV